MVNNGKSISLSRSPRCIPIDLEADIAIDSKYAHKVDQLLFGAQYIFVVAVFLCIRIIRIEMDKLCIKYLFRPIYPDASLSKMYLTMDAFCFVLRVYKELNCSFYHIKTINKINTTYDIFICALFFLL